MSNTVSYRNRYGDNIAFTQDVNKITMSGYNPDWLRCGYANDYDVAYEEYCKDNRTLYDVLYSNPVIDVQPYEPSSKQEFIKHLFDYDNKTEEYKWSDKYRKLVVSTTQIDMIDPPGGPYISLGTNLKGDFKDGIDRIITHIDIQPNSVIFTIK